MQKLHFPWLEVAAMYENRFLTRYVEIPEPIHDSPAITLHRQPRINLVLGRMDMESGIQNVADLSAPLQGFCSKRHQGMHPEQGGHLSVLGIMALADPSLVFLDTLSITVAVRDLVTETSTKTDLFECSLNLVKAAINTARRGMVVDYRGTTCVGRIHQGQ